MSKETRLLDDAQVRAQAHQIEIDLDAINFYAGDLREKLETLNKELEFADPCKDQLFEKFMYKLQRFVLPLGSVGELKELVKAMEEYGLPSAAEVAEILRQQKSDQTLPAPRSCAEGERRGVEKHLIKEPVHA
jgi:hypothetical protein